MARMIPDYIHRDCKSGAERKLFSRIQKELPDSYVVFHSLGLAKHAYKMRAEIDFVVISRRGLLCLEVKGGRIMHERGVWSFINRFDEVNSKRESPFDQASSGMFALRRGIEQKFGRRSPQRNAVIGYAVIFPDQSFSIESPEWDLQRIIDENRVGEALEKLIEEQFDHSWQEIRRTEGRECQDMTPPQVELLLKYLRPDFELVQSLSSRIGESHDRLLQLTEEQYEVLDNLRGNERVMISGGAGTGKTVLAVEKACRDAGAGRRVAFICYNRLLALHVRQVLQQRGYGDLVDVNTLHGYARKIITAAGFGDELPSEGGEKELFTEKYPELFAQAVVELFDEPPFDVLVVDEGQDLKAVHYVGMLDWLIPGGISQGRWVWFEDSQQNIFRPEREGAEQTALGSGHPAGYRLTKNCRNTRPISVFNSIATATDLQKCLVDSDLNVSPLFYRSDSHQLKLLENKLTTLLGGGVDPADIVLLSPHVQSKSVLKGLDKLAGLMLQPCGERDWQTGKVLRYATIQKFKGLEAKVVIVTDITDLASLEMRSLNYVAFSRPTSCLEVLIHEDAKEQYGQLAYEFGMRD